MRLAKTHFPVTVLGPGRRVGIWFQGCSIGCHGCVARDTWEHDDRFEIPVASVVRWCRTVADGPVDGVTVSGGEPFEQPQALEALLHELRRWDSLRRKQGWPPLDLLCYSGLPWRRLQRDHADLLTQLDAIIPEPFREEVEAPSAWRGSGNQPLVALTELGRERYTPDVDAEIPAPSVQVSVEAERVWMIGIPQRGDLVAFERHAEDRGLMVEEVSWRA